MLGVGGCRLAHRLAHCGSQNALPCDLWGRGRGVASVQANSSTTSSSLLAKKAHDSASCRWISLWHTTIMPKATVVLPGVVNTI
jgi:hypothetical protein